MIGSEASSDPKLQPERSGALLSLSEDDYEKVPDDFMEAYEQVFAHPPNRGASLGQDALHENHQRRDRHLSLQAPHQHPPRGPSFVRS
mmetsp:Transcript_38246/g.89801  ORF Transcript_38246/g.89801 Transcript_38246/m.89801 type:complete len:88 (+) Transcript_38246:331-594(+)